MADLATRSEPPISDWHPFRIVREMMRWDPFREMSAWMPRVLGRRERMPPFEIRESGTSLRILADVAGVQHGDVDIHVTGNRLVITGKREPEERDKDERVHTYERSFGPFTRTITLPEYVDPDHVSCDLRDGVLTIVVPKRPGEVSRKIAVGGPATKA